MEPLYGQKDLAEFCEFVIASLFEVAPTSTSLHQHNEPREGVDTPPYTPPPEGEASASSQRKEPPALVEFIAYALYRTRLPISIVHQSLLLLSRLKQRYPSARGTSSSPHRLFLSSLMLSAKISMDDTYSNKSWAIVGSSFFPLREVNQMERELFAFLGWNVVAQKDELDSFIASAQVSYAAAKASVRAERVKRRKMEEDEARDARHRQATNAARALLRPHTYRHSPSPTRSSASASSSSSSGVYTPASIASPSMQASPVASTSSQATSPSFASQQYEFGAHPSSSSSAAMMQVRTPYTPSSSSSITSSAVSSAFPSATHSPTSPASEPFSAGPQTPDSEFNYLHQHHHHHNPQHHHHPYAPQHQQRYHSQHEVSSDFPEADSYMKTKPRSISPPTSSSRNRKSYHHPSTTSPSFVHALSNSVLA